MTFNSLLLKEMLRRKRISQVDLANATGNHKRTISRWLSGKTVPKEKDRQKIAGVLGCDPTAFDASFSDEVGVAIHAKVSVASHNAFEVIGARFGVSQKQIIELAPVLFALVAERALQVPLEDERRPEPGKLPYYNQSSDQAEGFGLDKHAVQLGKCFGVSAGCREHATPRNLFEEAMGRILRDFIDKPNIALPESPPAPGTAPTAVGFNPWLTGISEVCGSDPELIEAVTQGRVRFADIVRAPKTGDGDIVSLMRSELKSYRGESERKLKEWQSAYTARHPDEAREYAAIVAAHCHSDGWYPEEYTAAQRARAKAEPWLEDRHLDTATLPGFAASPERSTDNKLSMTNFLWEMSDPVYQRYWKLRLHRVSSKREFERASK